MLRIIKIKLFDCRFLLMNLKCKKIEVIRVLEFLIN